VDYFDEQSLSSVATIADGGFKDLSGQGFSGPSWFPPRR